MSTYHKAVFQNECLAFTPFDGYLKLRIPEYF